MLKSYYLFLFYFLCYNYKIQGQLLGKKYLVSNYTIEDGLPQNSVKDIVFDKAGYCWMATEMGLSRFDGKQFKNYGIEEIIGLKSSRITELFKTNQGSIVAKSGNQLIIIDQHSKLSSPQPRIYNSSKKRLSIIINPSNKFVI